MKNNKMNFVGVMLFACVVSVAHAASSSLDDEFWGKISSNVENTNLSFFDFDNDSQAKSAEGFSNLLQERSENSLLSSYLFDHSLHPLPPMQGLFDARGVAVAVISATGQRSSQKRMTRSSQAREKGKPICPTSGKSFRYPSGLNGHEKTHSFDNDSQAECAQGFSALPQEGGENSHMLDHLFDPSRSLLFSGDEEPPVNSNLESLPTSKTVAAISAAEQRTSQERVTRTSQTREKGKHICSTCRESFRFLCLLKRHEKTHLPPEEKEFACDYPRCNYATDRKEDFNRHKNRHLPPEERAKPFKCGMCNYSTDCSRNLKGHINRRHAVENSNPSVENDSQAECAQGFSALPQESAENSHMPDHLFDPSLPQLFPVDEELPVYSDLEGLPTSIEIAQIEDSNSVNYDSGTVAAISAAEQRSSQERVTRTSQANEEDKYKCRTCERSFRYSSQLDIHEESHLLMPPEERQWTFKCGMCDYVTYQIGTFNRHVEREHASAPAFTDR